MNKQEWHTSLFDKLDNYWEEIVNARPTKKEVGFLESIIEKKGLLLDLCCGTGRHSILLSEKEWNVVGLDISANLLTIAKERMADKDVRFPLVRSEMGYLPFRSETFTAVINMFTSFGYLPSEEEDVKSLKEVARILRKDGSFLIDIVNREHLLQIFQKKDWAEFPSFYMLEERTLDGEGSRLYSHWIILDKNNGKTRTFNHDLRLYSFSQFELILEKAGLTIEKIYGGYERQEFRQDSSRLIVLAKKKIYL